MLFRVKVLYRGNRSGCKKLSGVGDPPKAFHTDEEMLKKVETIRGSIGFTDQSKVMNEVNVLAIIDKNKTYLWTSYEI